MSEKFVDLSLTLEEGMQTFAAPWHPFVEITQLGRHGIENRETRKLVLGTHTGTHIDAPRHFIAHGETVESIPLGLLNGPATVLDFSGFGDSKEIQRTDLATRLGDRSGERIVLRFDWDKKLGTNSYYSDHSYLSLDACDFLVEKGCRLLAMDTPQPDNPVNGRLSAVDSPNHKRLLGSGVILVEYLCNLDNLTSEKIYLIVAPLKIREGDGAPARVFAILRENDD